jgi:hypothetical protein
MTRPRKASNVLALTGAFKHNPARGRERELNPQRAKKLPPAPATFTEPQRAAYDEIVENAAHGVLGSSDAIAVQVAAVLYARFRANPTEFKVADIRLLHKSLTLLGMTPVDRSRAQVIDTEPEEDAPEDEFCKPRNGSS